MSKPRRLANILIALLIIGCGILLASDPTNGILLVIVILGMSLIIYGIRMLWFYVTMARHMVGGLALLYVSVIALDLGIFSVTLMKSSPIYLGLYLTACLIFDGGVRIMRGVEARKLGAHYRLQLFNGITTVIAALICVAFLGTPEVLTYMYSATLIYSALMRIASALRNTDIVYIP